MSATRDPPRSSWAASSSGSRSGLRNASRKTASIRVWVALPPAPCDIVMRSSLTRGRRRRARSMRSRTCCSRSASGSWRRGRVRRFLGRVRLLVLCLLVLCLLIVGVLTERLVDPARLALNPVTHRPRSCVTSATRVRFIRPKL